MNDDTPFAPYSVPLSARATWLTPQGFTPGQCMRRFFVAGVLAAAIGSAALYALTVVFPRAYAAIFFQLLALGLPFGIALWSSIDRHIGSLTTRGKLGIAIGCLAAFGTCGAVYMATLAERFWVVQPVTWDLAKCSVLSPAAGAAVLTIVLWLATQQLSRNTLLMGWIVLSVVGCIAVFVSDEFGMRRHVVDETIAACICGGTYVAVVLAVVGWQLAEANSAPIEEQAADG